MSIRSPRRQRLARAGTILMAAGLAMTLGAGTATGAGEPDTPSAAITAPARRAPHTPEPTGQNTPQTPAPTQADASGHAEPGNSTEPGQPTDPTQPADGTSAEEGAVDAAPAETGDQGDTSQQAPTGPDVAADDAPEVRDGVGGGADGGQGEESTARLTSGDLAVTVSTLFPQVISYELDGAGTMAGNAVPLTSMLINGVEREVTVGSRGGPTGNVWYYDITPTGLEGVMINATISVRPGNIVTFAIGRIVDPDKQVSTLQIPGHSLVSVSSTAAGAQIATATIPDAGEPSEDQIINLAADTPGQEPATFAYALASSGTVAAALETNAMTLTGQPSSDDSRFVRTLATDGAVATATLSTGSWLYRAGSATMPYDMTEELPWTKVVLTGDANADQVVDWQDAAVAMRAIAITPPGAETIPDTVVWRIPFNISSTATHPFLRTLDDTKRVALATDGLGQAVLLKGYQGAGHDTAHPDYAGNYNLQAGGLEDLNALIKAGKGWNATFGVHINASEAYPEAKSFTPELVTKELGWDWVDQAYKIDKFKDLASGGFERRITQLANETDDNLSFVYVDTYFDDGWRAETLEKQIHAAGFNIATEGSDNLEHSALFAHWAVEKALDSGNASQIIRFIHNGHADKWNAHPILGAPKLVGFEGWHKGNNWKSFKTAVWTKNLPAKFLQHHDILQWQDGEIRFTDGVIATGDTTGTYTSNRKITQDGTLILDGSKYLLPWSDAAGTASADRLYHYNGQGGESQWTLTPAFADATELTMYELTDTGRANPQVVAVQDGKVTLSAKPQTAYVLYRSAAAPGVSADPTWGEFTPIKDPGFNAGNLDAWSPNGAVSLAEFGKAPIFTGQAVAALGAGPASISQQLARLEPGTYSASVWVEIGGGAGQRDTTISVAGDGVTPISRTTSTTTAYNGTGSDDKKESYFQRLRVVFDVPAPGAAPTVTISAGAGDATVLLDDVRVVRTERAPVPAGLKGVPTLVEDFEHTDGGWGPFVRTASISDAHTHVAVANPPHTNAGKYSKVINDVVSGQASLRTHGETSRIYRTWPGTLPLEVGHTYRLTFDYLSSNATAIVEMGYDQVVDGEVREVSATTGAKDGAWKQTLYKTDKAVPSTFTREFTVTEPGSWLGLNRENDNGAKDFSLDNVVVTDLTVGALEVSGVVSPAQPDGEAGWYRTTPRPALATQGGNAGRTQGYVSTDAGKTWVAAAAQANAAGTEPVIGEGDTHLLWASHDEIQSVTGTLDLKVDTLAPQVTGRVVQDTPTGPARLTLTGTDSGSGLARLEWRVDGGAWRQAAPDAATTVADKAGTFQVEYRATDVAGNVSQLGSSTVVIKAGAPDPDPTTTPTAQPTHPADPTASAAASASAKPGGSLPLTGSAGWVIAGVAALAVAAGVMLTAMRRKGAAH